MSDALKPCPFCGGEAELMADHDNAWTNCPECQISLEGFETEIDAITAWNTRANMLTSENAALRLRIDDWREEAKSARSMRELYGRKNVELIAAKDALQSALAAALERLDASMFTNAEHQQAADILRNARKATP